MTEEPVMPQHNAHKFGVDHLLTLHSMVRNSGPKSSPSLTILFGFRIQLLGIHICTFQHLIVTNKIGRNPKSFIDERYTALSRDFLLTR